VSTKKTPDDYARETLEACRAARPDVVRRAMIAIGKLVYVPVVPRARSMTDAEWQALARRKTTHLKPERTPRQLLAGWGAPPRD